MKVIFTCGGTAGHVNPALALAGYMRQQDPKARFLFVGTPDGMERDLVEKAGYPFRGIPMGGFQRSLGHGGLGHNLNSLAMLARSRSRARAILRDFRPDLVVGTGGYASYPVVKCAAGMGIPTAVHESNMVPGLTTKMLEGSADRIMVGFEECRQHYKHPEKIVVTGTPVREDFFTLTREEAKKRLGINDGRPLIVSFWGSLGAAGMSLITLLDQALVMSTLQNTLGYTEAAATALYGEYTFGMTLFMLPPSFIYPLSVSLMPAVSAALTRRDRTAAGIAAGTALKLTVLAALPAGVGLSALAGPILQLLYPAVPETAEAAAYHLTFLGLACVFVCLMVATNGVLQAYGHPLLPVISLLCGGVLKIVTNYLMVGDPATGIRGAAVSTLYCYALIAVINLAAIARLVPERPGYISLFAKPVLLTAVMALAARSGYGLFCRLLPERWAVLPAVLLAAVVYVVLALAIGAVTRQDLQTLPKGEKLADRLHLR